MSDRLDLGGGDPAALKRRSVRGAAATFAGQGIRFVLQFAAQVLLARLLTPQQFGIVAMVAPLVGLVQLFAELGLAQAVIQRPSLTHRELSGLFWINGAVSLGLAVLLIVASPLVAAFYGEPKTMAVTASLALPLLLGSLAAQQMALMNRRLQFIALAAIDVGSTAASVVVGILCAWCGLGYWSLVAMQVANNAANLAAAWAVSGWRPGRPRLDAAVAPLLRFGGDVTGYNLVNYFSFNLDNVLIGWASGVAALGLYDRAFRLMLPSVMQLTTPFTRITVPLLSRLQAEPDRYRSSFSRVLQALLLATLPGLAWSIVFAGQLIATLLGVRWQAAGPILAALGAGALLLPVNNAVAWLFISQGRAREQLVWGAAGSGIVLASFVAGLPWGPIGVATASAAFAWAVGSPLLFWAATRRGPVGLRDLLGAIFPVASATLAASCVLAAIPGDIWPFGAAGLAAALAASYAVTGAVLACLPAGNRMLRDLWRLRSTLRAEPVTP
jgi:PST family polysaccharide transporter